MLAQLRKGTMMVRTGELTRQQPGSVKIKTPRTVLGVRGTTFVVSVDELGAALRPRDLGWVIAASVLCGDAAARADDGGYQLDHHEPTPAGDPFLVVEAPWYAAIRGWAAGLSLDYAHNLVAAQHRGPRASSSMIRRRSTARRHRAPRHRGRAARAGRADRERAALARPARHRVRGRRPERHHRGRSAAERPRAAVRRRRRHRRRAHARRVGVPVGPDRRRGQLRGRRGRARDGAPHRQRRRRAPCAGPPTPRSSRAGPRCCRRWSPRRQHRRQRGPARGGGGYLALDQPAEPGPRGDRALAIASDLPAAHDRATLEVLGAARYQLDDRFAFGLGVGTALSRRPGPPDARLLR